ncbi:Ig-like domain-containing protein [Anaeromyxobacter oryzisoli]|uniref:Ig-like domain-containing protein n=1 Tax=Anaeromyxobacter oryzisoli TaxID=2925408 RepID=UPI001F58B50C|nr:Ig-like domain-containing protein [Anaeromyxobacter sp. SG63]
MRNISRFDWVSRSPFRPLVVLACLAALIACGGGGGGGGSTLQTQLTLGADPSLPKGGSSQLSAIASRSDGASWDCTADAAWTSSDPSIASVQGGLVNAAGEGTATVSATCGDASASVQVTVLAAQLVLVDVAPIDPSVQVGGTVPLIANGTLSDDSLVDVTEIVTWTSSAPLVASVSAQGLVTAISEGTATITATDPVTGLQGATVVTVLPTNVPMQIAYLALSRGSIQGGGIVTGTVVLIRPTAEPIDVALATSDPVATVPASVTVPPGADRVSFQIATTTPPRRKVRVAIQATYDGMTKKANLNVRR